MKKKIIFFIEVLLVIVIFFQGYQVYQRIDSQEKLIEKEKHLTQIIGENEGVEKDKKKDYPRILEDLQKRYENVVALLIIPGTSINYPVVQGNDNSYYLNHDILHQSNVYGEIFMDYRNANDFSDENVIFYGHNAEDRKEIFYDLLKYKDAQFLSSHREVLLVTKEKVLHYRIYGAYILKPDFPYRIINFTSEEERQKYFRKMEKENTYSVERKNRAKPILTLSTCEGYDNRMVIQAELQ